jgi:hypothetical protein
MYVEPNYLNFSLILALGREAVSSQNNNIAFSWKGKMETEGQNGLKNLEAVSSLINEKMFAT